MNFTTAIRRLFQESARHYIEEKLIKNELIFFLKSKNPPNHEELEREEELLENLNDKILVLTRLANTTLIKQESLGINPFDLRPEDLLVPLELAPHLESELRFLKLLFKFCELHQQVYCTCNNNNITQIR